MSSDKIISLVDKLRAKEAETRYLQAHMDRLFQAHGILAKAVETMRDEGIADDEIVSTLRYAADLLSGTED